MPSSRHPAISPMDQMTNKQSTFNNSLDDSKPSNYSHLMSNGPMQDSNICSKTGKKNRSDKNRKYLVQTPKIKPVGTTFLGMHFNPQIIPGKLTSQNSTEDLHNDPMLDEHQGHNRATFIVKPTTKKPDIKSQAVAKSFHDVCMSPIANIIEEEKPKAIKHISKKTISLTAHPESTPSARKQNYSLNQQDILAVIQQT